MLKRTLLDIVYARRLHAKRAVSFAGRMLPAPLFRPLRAAAEQIAFRARPEYQGDGKNHTAQELGFTVPSN